MRDRIRGAGRTAEEATTTDEKPITDANALRGILGDVHPRAATKERARLHERDRQWLARSPFCVIATSDAHGNCDASPKGDPPGFVHVLDDSTIAIPERPGNRRGDGYFNILQNPRIGILSIIPGRTETLRINGRARLVRDAPFFDDLIVQGNRPILAIIVDIDTIFFHCARAFLRSRLWQHDTWEPDALPSTARLVSEVQPSAGEASEVERVYSAETMRGTLY
ncbi:MSMEG_1061 family FMN-dependent PPOX-type flavoprotein [Lolliginicoccus lacisalsi]|uniref:MSMEG_1061 family FMN-dependent PPOX-type flavoprotein n=1 Tax=Lolliginicoccus lacisalsi TaxID=2742202 RepID=UPI002FD594B5